MPTYNIKFVTGGADIGKIVAAITHAEDPATEVRLKITGPAGLVRDYPVAADFTGVSGTVKVSIPTDIDGNYLEGSYTFDVKITPPVNPESIDSETYALDLLDQDFELDINVFEDCYAKYLIIEDKTVYPDGFTPTRTITIDHPVIRDEDDIADTVSSTAVTTVSLTRSSGTAYENVTYGIKSSAVIIDETDADPFFFGVEYYYPEVSVEHKIVCNTDACNVIACVDKTIKALHALACKKGGIAALPKEDADLFSSILSALAMYNYAILCKDAERIRYWYDELKTLVGDCGCDEATGPIAIPDSNLIYLAGKSAYDLWIEAGNSGSLEDFFASLNPVGEWIDVPDADFDGVNFIRGLSLGLRYRILNAHIELVGNFQHTVSTPNPLPSNPIQVIASTFDPGVVVDTTARIPVWAAGPDVVGWFYKDTDGVWKMQWNSRYANSFGSAKRLSGMLPTTKNYVTVSQLTDWTTINDADLTSGVGYTGSTIQWRSDERFVYFRGSFDLTAVQSGGLEILPSAYFTSRGITLMEDSATWIVTQPVSGSIEAALVGYVKVGSTNNLVVFLYNVDLAERYTIYGMIRRA